MAMAECLVDAAGVVSSPQGQRLARLVYETGTPSPLLPQSQDIKRLGTRVISKLTVCNCNG